MEPSSHPEQIRLRATLIDRLKRFATSREDPRAQSGFRPLGTQLFTYCAFAEERIRRVQLPYPAIGVVLSGSKEVWLGDVGRRLLPGEVFVMPGNVELDVVNYPDDRQNLYESLLMEVRSVPLAITSRAGRPRASTASDIGVELTTELVDALGHAAIALAESAHAEALAEHRLTEVLMLLADLPAARSLFPLTLADRVCWTIRAQPSHDWTAAEIATRLGVGESTLRRHLSGQGTPLRQILAAVRMQVAHDLLANGGNSVTQAAQAAGYASRSHFARQFRNAHGQTPSESRNGA